MIMHVVPSLPSSGTKQPNSLMILADGIDDCDLLVTAQSTALLFCV